MRVPLSWLGEYVDLVGSGSAEEVAADLVRVGLEEEGLLEPDVSGPLVVGRVLSFEEEPQKNGRTIRWCSLDVGRGVDDPQQVVCGASNFAVGDLVVVVLPGGVLPGGFEISSRRTYGHRSDGMICSPQELGLGEDHDGIIVLSRWGLSGEPGDDAIPLLGLDAASGSAVEVNVTPDRGYCFSVRGVAREYAHATRRPVAEVFRDPADVPVPAPTADGHPVVLADDAPINGVPGCRRFVARLVRGVDGSAPSPYWMRRRLQLAGMRPISLVVDVTNYVMLAVGQPLHAYDLATVDGAITVRRARPGERLVTLDGADRALDGEDLLITDGGGADRVIGLAGVMGGRLTEVSASTRDVLVEAAWFDPVSVARTARRHRLPSEASRRFERGVDPALQAVAAELVVRLLVEHGGGVADRAVTDVGDPVLPASIEMPVDLPARLVGRDYAPQRVVDLLRETGCTVREADAGDGGAPGALTVTPPSWRPDLVQAADLVEEVARLDGYDLIPSVLPVAPAGRGLTQAQRVRRRVGAVLADAGLVEVLSYPFVGPQRHDEMGLAADDARRSALLLSNPLSDEQPQMRTSVLATLVDQVRRNVARGFTDVGLFELGLVTRPLSGAGSAPVPRVERRPDDAELAAVHAAVPPQPLRVAGVLAGRWESAGWWGPGRAADHTDAIALAVLVGRAVGVDLTVSQDEHAPWHPGRCARLSGPDGRLVGHAGELHPKAVAALGLPERAVAFELDVDVLADLAPDRVQAEAIRTFPVAKEDVALVVDAAVPAGDVAEALRQGGGDLLESVRLFDVYEGEQVGPGRRSLAFALRMRAPDRTLTAAEANAVRDAAVERAVAAVGAQMRS